MNDRTVIRAMRPSVFALVLTLAVPGAAKAGSGTGVHGGGRPGDSGHLGGRTALHGSGFPGALGYFRRWRGPGPGYGLFFDLLPLYYPTLWWSAVPYYYPGASYYQWNSTRSSFETIPPPREVKSRSALSETTVTDLFVYPKNWQNTEQQAQDRSECRGWAAQQTGIDPTQAAGTMVEATVPITTRRQDYLRAETTCLEVRGYSGK